MAETTREMSFTIKPRFHWMTVVLQCLICATFGMIGAAFGAWAVVFS